MLKIEILCPRDARALDYRNKKKFSVPVILTPSEAWRKDLFGGSVQPVYMLKDKALFLLARREHSRCELFYKLAQRGFAAGEINDLLNELQDEDLLNERRFIASFIRVRRGRGEGPLKICLELQKRGIDREQIETNEEWPLTLSLENAVKVRIKRFGNHLACDHNERARQMRYLQQRGFTSEQIRYALKAQSE